MLAPSVCKSADTCCRWNLFPAAWMNQFKEDPRYAKIGVPAYAVSSFMVPKHNKQNLIHFYCADKRAKQHSSLPAMPKGESAFRGPWIIKCSENESRRTWPTTGPLNSEVLYRAECVKVDDMNANKYTIYDIAPGDQTVCTDWDIADRGSTITVSSYSRDQPTQLMNSYISVTAIEASPPEGQNGKPALAPVNHFGSSYSTSIDRKGIYQVCVTNNAKNGNLPVDTLYADLILTD